MSAADTNNEMKISVPSADVHVMRARSAIVRAMREGCIQGATW
jgi:hypothetical protein